MSTLQYAALQLMKPPPSVEFAGSGVIGPLEFSLTLGLPGIASQDISGIFSVLIDCSQMVAGDQYRLRCYEKTDAAAFQHLLWAETIEAAQPNLEFQGRYALLHGWDFTLQQTAGAVSRSFSWSVRA